MLIKDERGKTPNYVIEGDPPRMRHQPTGLSVPLASRLKEHVQTAHSKLKRMVREQS